MTESVVIARAQPVAIHWPSVNEPYAQFFAQSKTTGINEFDPQSVSMFHRPTSAPVVQGIEHWSPEPLFQFPCNWDFHHEGSGNKTKALLSSGIQGGDPLPCPTWLKFANRKADERKCVFDAKNITPTLHRGRGGASARTRDFLIIMTTPGKFCAIRRG